MSSSPINGPTAQPIAGLGERHVFLVGFMGSGKTTVGRALAERINRGFVDLDQVIVEEAGTSIREIFRKHGEVGFRARERAALREVLNGSEAMVVATGAGTFTDATMREWIQEAGRTIYLMASPDVLVARINDGQARFQRPLVSGPHPEETVRRVLTHRSPAYEECDVTVRTDLARVEHVVEEIVRALRLERPRERRGPKRSRSRATVDATVTGDAVSVKTSAGKFPVQVRTTDDEGWLAAQIRASCSGKRVAVVSDDTVASLHGEALVAQLRHAGKSSSLHTITPGEQSKVLSTAASLYDGLLAEGITRKDAIVALGGGVVCDLTGFVASTLHGGISHVNIPTTTVAAMEAPNGQTGINTRHGPNLIGTFYPPKAVLVVVRLLASQSRRRHASGLATAVQMAATLDAGFFDALALDAGKLLSFEPEPLALAIERAIALRATATNGAAVDPAALRFGRTIAPAIEAADRQILPGEATALGMLAECAWAESESNPNQTGRLLEDGLAALELPTDWRSAALDPEVVGADSAGGNVRLAHVTKLGSYEVHSVPVSALVEFVRGRRSS